MQIGMMGLGRMGANMVRRLLRDGHQCVVYDINPDAVAASSRRRHRRCLDGRVRRQALKAAQRLADAAGGDHRPTSKSSSCCWNRATSSSMAATPTIATRSIRPPALKPKELAYVDVGTSGGVWGLERGFCLMIGGPDHAVKHLDPVFATLAPGAGSDTAPSRDTAGPGAPLDAFGTARLGYCIAGRAAPAISSRWCITASNMASWPPMPRASTF